MNTKRDDNPTRLVEIEVPEERLSDSWAYSDDDVAVLVTFVVIGPREHLMEDDVFRLDVDAACSYSTSLIDAQEMP